MPLLDAIHCITDNNNNSCSLHLPLNQSVSRLHYGATLQGFSACANHREIALRQLRTAPRCQPSKRLSRRVPNTNCFEFNRTLLYCVLAQTSSSSVFTLLTFAPNIVGNARVGGPANEKDVAFRDHAAIVAASPDCGALIDIV